MENLLIGIVANKSDLFEKQEVSKEEGEQYAKDKNLLFFETSAKDYASINNVFIEICKAYLEKNANSSSSQQNNKDDKQNNNKSSVEPLENDVNLNDIDKKPDCSSKCSII